MAVQYTTKAGETLAMIAKKYYGSTANRTVEQILEANHGLAGQKLQLPQGVVIVLPEISNPEKTEGIRLWT